ncbi:MAG: twin-arginine translocase TatA/TatE family subunit [Chloroflexi bacterium]|nr:twin-arginine translocase TatA/TatE family subunit [Chloroflexota bacterium]
MEILGVGMSELVFILIIALIVLGPKDMQKAGKTIGKWMRSIVTSDGWKIFQKTSRELRTLPNKLIREANEELSQINFIGNQVGKEIKNASNLTPQRIHTPNTPPHSQPFTATPTPPEPAKKANTPTTLERKENESGQQNDA